MSDMLIDYKKKHALILKILKPIDIFHYMNRFIYEHICIDFLF